ncbi:phosphate signaling complex protein PhoU [Neisseria shayeganii]|uniref:Phosphate-specific transport system accessory protein PhoU n=1 Tax=Neisseria shayeganii 871 TaxID=1032488 RepID=G4CH91_9NEIS|nr:phosphate signaling complex protein PhoU [Neisseria shayeganii]EGY52801.1 phosphate transport system regulatory protein PhoU [Neisseria shayeganii 871]
MAEHISSHFHQELETVRSEVMRMGGLVEQQLQAVLAAFSTGSADGLSAVIEGDHAINALEVAIDDHCQTIIARRQPAAGDLRLVLAVSRIIVDLERMGDELKKIARMAHPLLAENRIAVGELYDTHRLAGMTASMIRRALDAFARLDAGALPDLNAADRHLDAGYRRQFRLLLSHMMEEPRQTGILLDVTMMNKRIERIGDHAKNIAEHVVYLVRGIDVRHRPPEAIRQDGLPDGDLSENIP